MGTRPNASRYIHHPAQTTALDGGWRLITVNPEDPNSAPPHGYAVVRKIKDYGHDTTAVHRFAFRLIKCTRRPIQDVKQISQRIAHYYNNVLVEMAEATGMYGEHNYVQPVINHIDYLHHDHLPVDSSCVTV